MRREEEGAGVEAAEGQGSSAEASTPPRTPRPGTTSTSSAVRGSHETSRVPDMPLPLLAKVEKEAEEEEGGSSAGAPPLALARRATAPELLLLRLAPFLAAALRSRAAPPPPPPPESSLSAAEVIAEARGCVECASRAAAAAKSARRGKRAAGDAEVAPSPPALPLPPRPSPRKTSTTLGTPNVSVPVLSKMTADSLAPLSSASPPLTRTPCEAATPVPTMTAVGVASPRAQGQATTSTAIEKRSAKRNGVWPRGSHSAG